MTNHDELARCCRMFSDHGASEKHEHEIEGINSPRSLAPRRLSPSARSRTRARRVGHARSRIRSLARSRLE